MLVFNSPYRLFLLPVFYISCVAAASDSRLSVVPNKQNVSVDNHMLSSGTFLDDSFRAQLSAYKDTAVQKWQDLPVWGKCLVGGAATAGLFGSLCFVNYLRLKEPLDPSAVVFARSERPIITAGEARDVLAKGVEDARELLKLSSDDQQRAVLKDVFRSIIREHYTATEEAILRNLLQGFQSLFQQADWQELLEYASEHEASENDYVLKEWLQQRL